MHSVLVGNPGDASIETVIEPQVRAEPLGVGGAISGSQGERVFVVVQVPQIDVAVDGVVAVPLHADVLDLGLAKQRLR